MHILHRILADIEDLGINSSDLSKEMTKREQILEEKDIKILEDDEFYFPCDPYNYIFDWIDEYNFSNIDMLDDWLDRVMMYDQDICKWLYLAYSNNAILGIAIVSYDHLYYERYNDDLSDIEKRIVRKRIYDNIFRFRDAILIAHWDSDSEFPLSIEEIKNFKDNGIIITENYAILSKSLPKMEDKC